MWVLSVSENVLAFIAGVGILQGILLSVLVYSHRNSDRVVNKFLAFYLADLSIIMAGPLLLKIIGWKNSFAIAAFPLLTGPLLYFYIRSFTERITWQKAWPHLILFFAYNIFSYLFVNYLADRFPGSTDFPKEGFRSPIAICFFLVRYTQLIIYYFLARAVLRNYQRSIQHLFSETSTINLNWVRWLVNGYILIILTSIVIYFLMGTYPENFYQLYLLNIAVVTPYIYMATYKGITQPTIWQKFPRNDQSSLERQLEKTTRVDKAGQRTQQKPLLNETRINEIVAKVKSIMDGEKIYLEPELTLQDLSDKLDCASHQVSLALNEGMKKSFYELINGYRVEEAKAILLDPKNKNFTILSAGFEAGFNSKTTFNTVFKKFTGLTPTEFRNQAGSGSH